MSLKYLGVWVGISSMSSNHVNAFPCLWMALAFPVQCSSNALKLEGAAYKKNSLDSKSNGASSVLEIKRGHLGRYGHGNDRHIGPGQFCTA